MTSGLLVCSSFTSTTCSSQEQGGIVRRLRPLSQIKGLNLRYQEPKNLTYDIPKRYSARIYASLPHNLENVEVPTGDAFVQESNLSTPSWTKKLDIFRRFAHTYVIFGNIIGILSMSLLPVQTMVDLSPAYFIAALQAILPRVLMTVYISTLNQITDIEIDKINKPHYPLASGEISLSTATAITSISAILSVITVVMLNSPPLLCCILTLFFIGTAYSVDLPLLRWKKNIFLTSVFFIFDKALLLPLCYFAHFQKYILGRPLVYTKPVFFIVVFMTIMSIVLAIVKDIPDVKGDKAFGMRSASIIFGVEKVFWSCVYTLMVTYGGAVIFGATSVFLPNKIIIVLGHGILATILWNMAKSINTSDPSSTYFFYQFLWKLVYVEYLIFPFIR